ncbi:MAG: exodeoxyribonuclease VII small subunit [Cocleimonas sp.]|nr:exodeoxyribonuclease VII small subunit [Cocleimonas sp.]
MTKKSQTPDFETAMTELEALVAQIETGNLSLEESLKQFEQGIKLSRTCQKALTEAEQRVKILTDSLNSNTIDNEEDFHIPE